MDEDFFNNPDLQKVKHFLLSKKRASSQLSHYLNNKFQNSKLKTIVETQYGENLNQKMFSLAYELNDAPKCYCGNKLSFLTFSRGYSNFCSTKCSSSHNDTITKTEQTRYDKYGIRELSKINSSKKTEVFIEKYGVEHPMQNDDVKNRRSETLTSKYGGVGFASKEINQKIEDTMVKKYGVPRNNHSSVLIEQYVKNSLEREFNKRVEQYSNFHIHRQVDEYEGQSQFHLMTCRRCGTQIERNFMHGGPKCPKCDIGVGSSIAERQLRDIVKSFLPEDSVVITGAKIFDNPQLSVDVYVPHLKIAFEFNGLYWHSTKFKDKWYHHDKTEQLREKGIKLFHVFEDDFLNRQQIIISMIRTQLQVQSNKIYARKCKVVELAAKEAREFCERTHLQGFLAGSLYVGLKFNGVLVSVMTISKSRFNKKYEWELGRWCCELDLIVVGGFSKCLSYVKNKINNAGILTYCDASHSYGETYNKFGKFLYHSEPNYFYFKTGTDRISRLKFQKHKLKEFSNFDPAKTEKQIMQENGWKIIYDCGNMVFEI